jgi:CHAD domain-containing protein
MADGKWIEDLQPGLSLHAAARKALQVRLGVVRDTLPPAVRESEKDPEHVHRLRVATRRADAALRIFRSNLPDDAFKTARRRLRRLRRAAGEARDWDVFLFDLIDRRRQRPAGDRAGLDFLIGLAFGQRSAAQPGLVDAANGGDEAWHEDCIERVADAVLPADNGATLGQLARPLVASLVHRLEEAVSGDLTDYANLHQVRIAGKRLRYAMELFAGCFAAEFRIDIYPLVEDVQEVLGRANDSHVAVERLLAVRERLRVANPAEWKRLQAGVDSVLRFHRLRLPRERRSFLAWWARWEKKTGPQLARILRTESPRVTAT